MFDSPQVHHRQILSVGTQMSLLTVMSELESVSLLLCNLVLKADGTTFNVFKLVKTDILTRAQKKFFWTVTIDVSNQRASSADID